MGGAGTTGSAGTTGAAGATGSAGTVGATGSAGTTGAAGSTSTAGTGGSASGLAGRGGGAGGRGGAAGTGPAGRGGTTGSAGRGGTTGAAGSAGSVGTTGGAGTTGAAGTTGTGGSADVCTRWKADRADLSEGTWTGDVTSCTPGDIGATARANALRLVNLYRALAQLPAVVTDPTRDGQDQACALMMRANNMISHTPPTTWTCYTADGADRRRELERLQRARGQLRRPLHDRPWQRDDDRPPALDPVELARADRHRRHRQGVVHVDAERHRQGGQGVDGVARAAGRFRYKPCRPRGPPST